MLVASCASGATRHAVPSNTRSLPNVTSEDWREDHPPWKELYILTGGKTFSAAVMVLDQFIKHTSATLIGEPAGAALNSFGDPIKRKYSRTGLLLKVSTLRHRLGESSDIREFIAVDVPASFSFNEYVNGRDPAVDAILRGDEIAESCRSRWLLAVQPHAIYILVGRSALPEIPRGRHQPRLKSATRATAPEELGQRPSSR